MRPNPHGILWADDSVVHSKGIGSVTTRDGQFITLDNVLFVPVLAMNLLSVNPLHTTNNIAELLQGLGLDVQSDIAPFRRHHE